MATPNANSPEVLSGEILAEAGRKCDEILYRARQVAESLLATATAEADKIRKDKLDAAKAEAARRTELILATVPVEAGRLRAARTEAILENIREAARRQLQSHHSERHETVVALAGDGLRRMPGTDFTLKLSAADHAAFGDKLTEEICRRAGRSPLKLTAVADPAVTDGGVIVQAGDGLRIWDNRLLSRLERLWPELRRQIAVRTGLVEKHTPTGGAA
jgi:vacuolar-type H+-ATPase subunit E/Vma4